MMNYQIQSVLLHISSLHSIGRFQNFNNILESDVHLEILLAKRLQSVVRETVKYRRGE
jgi:hypothetical protein